MKCSKLMLTGCFCTLLGAAVLVFRIVSYQRDDVPSGNASLTVTDTAQVSAAGDDGVGELMTEQNTTTPPIVRKMYVIQTEEVSEVQTFEEDRSNNQPLTTSMRSEENNQLLDKTETAGNASLTMTDAAQVSAAAGQGVGELMAEQNTITPPTHRKMYEIRTDRASWKAAVNKCKADNMTLASIRSIEELIEFNNTVIRKGFPIYSESVWLGASELGRKVYHVVWVGDNSRLNYTNWGEGEPASMTGLHCVLIDHELQWYLWNCSDEGAYACEYYN